MKKEVPCDLCKGKRVLRQKRCPLSIIRRHPELQRAFRLYTFFKDGGALPEPGGMNDQPATWVGAIGVFQQVLADLEKQAFDRAKK